MVVPEALAGEPVGGEQAASAVMNVVLDALALPRVSGWGRERLPRPAGVAGAGWRAAALSLGVAQWAQTRVI